MSNLARLTERQPVDGALLSDLNLNLVHNHGPTRPPWRVRGGTTWADHHRARGWDAWRSAATLRCLARLTGSPLNVLEQRGLDLEP
jgi:hypothetical protein